jgi:hypothetical protein
LTAQAKRHLIRFTLMVVVALVAVLADEAAALAQSSACRQLSQTLGMLERNADFRKLQDSSDKARALAAEVQQDSSSYVRGGCQAVQNSGQRLPPQCQTLARRIIAARRDYNSLAQSIQTGNAVAQQREQVLQQIARFGCGSVQPRRPRNLFEQLFGPYMQSPQGEGNFIEDPNGFGWSTNRNTVRTMCVRLSDGYYFPISYATLPDYIPQDADACRAACPGADVELYFYDNPGQEPEQMINQEGQPYTSLANAFAYRKAVDPNATCRPPSNPEGDVTLIQMPNGRSRPMVKVNGVEFPLPVLDPRRQQSATAAPIKVARAPAVPLPRPRPGSAPAERAPAPVKPPVATADSRIVEIAGKKVRIVGPDTPYGRPVGAGS